MGAAASNTTTFENGNLERVYEWSAMREADIGFDAIKTESALGEKIAKSILKYP